MDDGRTRRREVVVVDAGVGMPKVPLTPTACNPVLAPSSCDGTVDRTCQSG